MLIRCKCGRFTNYGLTCVACKVDTTGSEYTRDDDDWTEPMDDRRGDSPLPWGDEEDDEEDED